MKMISKELATTWILAAAALVALSASGLAHAADGTAASGDATQLYVGALVGANFPNGDADSSKAAVFGATIGAKVHPSFGVGFLGTIYGQDNTGSFLGLPAGTSTRTYNLLGQLNFFAANVLRVGADAGMMINTWSGNLGSLSGRTSNKTFVYGPQVAIDVPILPVLSVGAEAHYLINHDNGNQNSLLLLGAVKFWL